MIKVTVIIPVYNGEKWLEKCVKSILNQSYKFFDLLIINDGSTDNTSMVCENLKQQDNRIKIIHKKLNEGLIRARITGIQSALTDRIAFVDADDWVEKTYLENLMNIMNVSDCDMVISGLIREENNKKEYIYNQIADGLYEGDRLKNEIYSRMLSDKDFYNFGIMPYLWNKLFRKSILQSCYENIDTDIDDGEDVAVTYNYILKSNRISIISDCLYHYNIHSESMTFYKKENFYANESKLYLYLYNSFKKFDCFDILLPQLNHYMQRMIWIGDRDNFIEATQYFFPFKKVPSNSRIILYGAGFVGKNYFYQLKQTNYCKVVMWVDKQYEKMHDKLNIIGLDKIKEVEFDFIIIAIKDENICKLVMENLSKEYNISSEKILY